MVYYGQTASKFIIRYRNHISNFKNEKYSKNTELSKYIWKLKNEGVNYEIKWEIHKRIKPYNPGGKRCNLCIGEAMSILYHNENDNLINKKDEVLHNCMHRRKWKLSEYGISK